MSREVCEHFNPVDLPCDKCKAAPIAWYHVPYPNNGAAPMVSLSQQREPSMYGATVPLYLAPPQRKPLSEAKIKKLLIESAGMTIQFNDVDLRFARAIERAHGIGVDK